MLCQFTFKNFKSYRDETVFDLQATKVDEHSDSLLSCAGDKRKYISTSVIYGPNAGGKSGVIEALTSLVSFVMSPIELMSEVPKQKLSMRFVECPPFAFDNVSQNMPTEFTLYFQQNESEFRYTLFLQDGNVVSESLFRKGIGAKNPAKIFTRDLDGVQLGASLHNKKSINMNVNSSMPYISFLAISYNYEIISSAIEWFSKCICINYAITNPNNFISSHPSKKNSVLAMLKDVNIPISDYFVKTIIDEKTGEKLHDTLQVEREINGHKYNLNISEESRGTIKLFGIFPLVLAALSEGRLFVADELDASLHPKLLRYIIKLFKDKSINKHNAQLIFTSHDITTMKNDLFRRDEIWFAVKDDDGASEIYSLYEIRNKDGSHVKSTAPFDKQYLEGRYGADPYLSEMLSTNWEE